MARSCVVVCALVLAACPGNPYVIGHYADAGRGVVAEDGSSAALDGAVEAGRNELVDECSQLHAGALLCSGFEPEELTADWDVAVTREATLARSTARSHLGAGSLHATTEGASSYAIAIARFAALRSGELFVRAYLYVPADQPTEIMNILFVGDDKRTEPFQGIDVNLQSGVPYVFSPQSNPTRHAGLFAIPRDRWFCLRARFVIDALQGSVQLYIDDQLALESRRFDTLPDDGIDVVRAGIDWSSEQAARFEIYFDDMVVDTAPVACR
jgi:hypothetical protein